MCIRDKAKDLLAKRGFDPVLGARPLRRTIQREIEDHLSEEILFGNVASGEIVTVDVDNWDGGPRTEGATFVFGSRPKPAPVVIPEVEDEAETADATADAGADTGDAQ